MTENDAEYRAAAIRELSAIMDEEDAKPEKEKDYGLIAECAEMTAELKGLKTKFSDEELHELAEQVRQRFVSNKKRRRKIGRLLLAACITMLILAVSVLALAPRDHFIEIYSLLSKKGAGSSLIEGNNEYTYVGSIFLIPMKNTCYTLYKNFWYTFIGKDYDTLLSILSALEEVSYE